MLPTPAAARRAFLATRPFARRVLPRSRINAIRRRRARRLPRARKSTIPILGQVLKGQRVRRRRRPRTTVRIAGPAYAAPPKAVRAYKPPRRRERESAARGPRPQVGQVPHRRVLTTCRRPTSVADGHEPAVLGVGGRPKLSKAAPTPWPQGLKRVPPAQA